MLSASRAEAAGGGEEGGEEDREEGGREEKPEGGAEAVAEATADCPDVEALPEDLRTGGINVAVYWLDSGMRPYRITAADLLGRSAAELEYQLPYLAEPLPSIEVRCLDHMLSYTRRPDIICSHIST